MEVQLRSIARSVVIVSFVAMVVAAASVLGQQQPEPRQATRVEGATMPDPPRQNEPWRAPATTLPRFLAGASALLFEQGLADPRGCDYRSIEIGDGNLWSGPVMKTHGWVLPPRGGETRRFAVAWNGLVYPIASAGEPADLEVNVKSLARRARGPRQESDGTDPVRLVQRASRGAGGFARELGGDQGLPAATAGPGRPGRGGLGRGDGRADRRLPSSRDFECGSDQQRRFLFDAGQRPGLVPLRPRGLRHSRGDDVIALADARKLTILQKAVETRARAMDFSRPYGGSSSKPQTMPYIGFLHQLPDLLADQERRAREPRRPPVPPPGTDKKARIAALIAELDQIASWGVGPSIVKALVAEGEDAIDPLIEAAEHDTRLTRSLAPLMHSSARDREIRPVREFEYTALRDLLKTSVVGPGDARAYWEKYRRMPPVERWYRTIADDHASPAEWLEAADRIVHRENVSVVSPSDAFRTTVTHAIPPGVRPKLEGEVLRDKKNPSVAELMARRASELDSGGPVVDNWSDEQKVGLANKMAAVLAEWDITAALPVLKARVVRSTHVCALRASGREKTQFPRDGGRHRQPDRTPRQARRP